MPAADALVNRLRDGGEVRCPIFGVRWHRGRRQKCPGRWAMDPGWEGRGGGEVGSGGGMGKFGVADWWGKNGWREVNSRARVTVAAKCGELLGSAAASPISGGSWARACHEDRARVGVGSAAVAPHYETGDHGEVVARSCRGGGWSRGLGAADRSLFPAQLCRSAAPEGSHGHPSAGAPAYFASPLTAVGPEQVSAVGG